MNSCKPLLQNALIDIELDNLHVGGDADHTGENCTRERVHEGYGSPHILMFGLARARYFPEMLVGPGRDAGCSAHPLEVCCLIIPASAIS